ncbi:MAG TPA: hypothetical protein VGM90_20300 [Kofleriaceae bacterium]
MRDLTRGLRPRRFDAALLVDLAWSEHDPDGDAFRASWVSDGVIDSAYELTTSQVISLYELR